MYTYIRLKEPLNCCLVCILSSYNAHVNSQYACVMVSSSCLNRELNKILFIYAWNWCAKLNLLSISAFSIVSPCLCSSFTGRRIATCLYCFTLAVCIPAVEFLRFLFSLEIRNVLLSMKSFIVTQTIKIQFAFQLE